MEDLPIDTMKLIFDKIVIVDQENYVFVINASNKPLEKDVLKKVAKTNPLLESRCKGKNRDVSLLTGKL